ncbi:hypothetical protein KC19_VG121100 [Ceratodon purpureus]|uniref:Uncharacterized protein n=1 Tax=Ceratodon purpureus TaxID=3225 RepID=A0A8T0HPQ5_CERPU|nr:hypothetical protein KC19_VG121100 [Ceratodon purpureus]
MTGLVQHMVHIYDDMVGNAYDDQDNVEVQHAQDPGEQQLGGNERGRDEDFRRDIPNVEREPAGREDVLGNDNLPAMDNAPPSQKQLLEESARTPLLWIRFNTAWGHSVTPQLPSHPRRLQQPVNELFLILSISLLSTANSLPRNEYKASKILKQLGLAYDTIHCCPGLDTCILF